MSQPTPPEVGAADTAPTTGQRIRITSVGEPEHVLYVGAEGTITEVYREAIAVDWDDPALVSTALLRQADTWEVLL